MCVNATVTGSEVEYILSSTGVRTIGWMGIGWGRQMSGSKIVVVWPNSDGTFTLSQRIATGHVLPSVDSNPSRVATMQQSASDVTGSLPKFAFTMPVATVGTENIIWAFGLTNPGSTSPSASFTQHWDVGQSSLDLSKSLSTSTSSTSTPSSTNGSGNNGNNSSSNNNNNNNNGGTSLPLTKTDRMIIAHGILCLVGFLFFLPLGALIARYFRTSTTAWFKVHQTIQSFIAGPIITVGWALGVAIVATGGGPHFTDTHTRLGLAIFILYVVQVLLGNIIHLFKPKSFLRRRPIQNYLHGFLGIVIIGISFYQVRIGYKIEYIEATGRDPLPKAVDIVYYVWVAVIPLLYFAGLSFLPKQYKQEAASRRRKEVSYEMDGGYRD
ncbi:CBD9-like protein [Thelephora ganbajun]|uniref:CBD9-like protein n=1 Tax=Thelephora ganbajun TaxID=370292 RepID=A0ACB6ZGR4_THEGA|nr:CBD9-like protein [Thelephora ganbajun]